MGINPEVTAVGRMLKAKPGQKHVYKVIAVKAERQVHTMINRSVSELSPAARTVRDAFDMAVIDTRVFGDSDRRLAAALRAVADQLGEEMIVSAEGFKGITQDELSVIHVSDLLALVAELEAQ